MIEKINAFSGFIQVTVYVITVVSLFWKIKNDIKTTNLRVEQGFERLEAIEQDRKEKWRCYEIEKKNQECSTRELISKVDGIQGDIKSIRTDLGWLKNKK